MNFMVDDIIYFNNYSYLVLDVIKKDEIVYLYLINNDEYINDTAIIKYENKEYKHIEDDNEFNYVVSKLLLDYKDDLIMIANS